ncbi:MAG: DNA repair protein RadC [Bacteroidia bacterium]|nr:DNA repair protein RadC [Bacteroidia bacterium]
MKMKEEIGGTRRHSLKLWPENERPREKLLRQGAEVLSDSELLAILINTGSTGMTALDVARDLLLRHETLRRLATRPVSELCAFSGIGPARAATIFAAFELGRRYASAGDEERDSIRAPEDVARIYIPKLRDWPTERFIALLMNNSGRVLREHVVSEGLVNASLAHPREVFRAAVTEYASSIILLHNHPSGVREASKEDHVITKQLIEAGKMMGIPIQDHVIICGSNYISFVESGWM